VVVRLHNSWLWEQDRKLRRDEVQRIGRQLGYYLVENFLEFLMEKYPNGVFKVDEDYRITGRIRKHTKE
jgi:hypothetical protein